MGFNISPVLWQRLRGAAKSAGRVQSPALRLVVDREIEIEKFKSEEYWTISSDFMDENGSLIQANLSMVNNEKVEKFSFKDSDTCLLYTSPSPRDRTRSRMPSSA